jgi:hypothetical protein
MAEDEDDDLYEEEYDFVDDDDESDEEEAGEDDAANAEEEEEGKALNGEGEDVDEYGRPSPAANYVVHVYEYNKFKRTIERPFTPEEAEAFATEYNRTAKTHGRVALAGKNDVKPKKSID